MSDWVGLFINYETVGKKLKPHKTETLNRRQSESEKLNPHRAVIQINSTYLELIDRWNFWRGLISIASLCFIAIMTVGIGGLFYYGFYNPSYSTSIVENMIDIFFILVFFGGIIIFSHMLKRECFSYTYYPIRFNRKLKKVYVIQPNRKLLVANWDDFNISLQQYSRRGWDVRFSLLDEQEKVTETFALPYTGHSQYDSFLLAHWEFVCRYMEDDSAKASYTAVHGVFPIHHRKEYFRETVERVMIAATGSDQPVNRIQRLIFWGLFPISFIFLVGRMLSVKTSKIPKFPDWVEQECQIEVNDPYDFEQNPKPKLQSEPIKPFEYVIYIALLLISIIIFLGFIDLLSLVKGENSGLLKALFFW
ncbi:DUF6708 domain-containing protein [Acinetobacter sp. ANC 3882]|uniref:DUF6708 domain-containing protein n=1 Tax=Acinetobacter sp. ANC 3882 TaxID=2923423 RepID=UPI001F4A2558|nr:DUF6708 domain-containing protein [Acinetobacter sp. ANC 3882]MCH7315811.1 hypothetical protein [Acinetobacter sp. ANC 3882]